MKQIRPALILSALFLLFAGLGFPLLITAIAQAAMPYQANGSMRVRNGAVIGSDLIGQNFAGERYFHPRPSAAGAGYDANNSAGTNLGPTNPKLLEGAEGFDGIKQLSEKYRKENGLGANEVIPVDAVTRSASGLDPEISPRNAELQAQRVATARKIPVEKVRELIRKSTQAPLLGVIGDPRVNVLSLNVALDDLDR